MRALIFVVYGLVTTTAGVAAEDYGTDRYWRPEMRVGPDRTSPQVLSKDEAKKLKPQSAPEEQDRDIDRRLAQCLSTQAEYQANSYFSPSFKTNLIAAVARLLSRCPEAVSDWEKLCVRSGDSQGSCELKSALIATKALKEAGAQ